MGVGLGEFESRIHGMLKQGSNALLKGRWSCTSGCAVGSAAAVEEEGSEGKVCTDVAKVK